MNSIIFSFKNIAFCAVLVAGHVIFEIRKNKLIDRLEDWWKDFVDLATKYVPEEELHQRMSSVKGRPSIPLLKLDKKAFHDFTSQVTRGSLITSPVYIGKTTEEEMNIRFSFPHIFYNQF